MPECVVLGAGIIGVSIAYRLAEQGVRVTLVDARGPASGTTGTSGSMVGANEKVPYDYYRLGLLSMAAMRRLSDEFPTSSWYLGTGHLEWANSTAGNAALAARVQRLTEWAYPMHRLPPEHVMRAMEPDLLIPEGVDEVMFFSDDSLIYPHTLIALLLRRLTALGVQMYFGVGDAELAVRDGRVDGVRTGDGRLHAADLVVVAAGRWTQRLLESQGVMLPMVSPWTSTPEAFGFQVITTPAPVDVRRMIRMPGLSIRPAGGGRLMLHGRPEEHEMNALGAATAIQWDRPLVPVPPQAEALLAKAKQVLPNAAHAQVQSATAAIRALTDDGLPAVGWVPGRDGLYVAVTHSGIGLGPLLGELVASEVLGHENPLLTNFRPGRFAEADFAARPRPMRDHAHANAPTN